MGSSYFYLEFLLAWISLLAVAGYRNPAIYALEYSLVPEATFPVQLEEALHGYSYALSMTDDPSKVCVSGDSAGAALVLSMLLVLGTENRERLDDDATIPMPALCVLISPWVTLISPLHKNTASDYLDATTLEEYAREYMGIIDRIEHPRFRLDVSSPGKCRDPSDWQLAKPKHGFFITYGAEEVFAPDIKDFISFLRGNMIKVESSEEPGGIHAWPVASLFLSSSADKRLKGLKQIAGRIREKILIQ
jgi:acetyl esterase/lipase